MEKSVPKVSVRQETSKTAAPEEVRATGGRLAVFMWLSRFFNVLCFVLVFSCSVLSLSLIHIAKEADVYAVLVTAPTYSDNLAYFEPLHPDMPVMDILAETFVRQYLVSRNNFYPNAREMRAMWGPGGVVRRMSSNDVYETFKKKELRRYFPKEKIEKTAPYIMIDTDIKRIFKEGWNSWQIFFDTRKVEGKTEGMAAGEAVVEHWLATIQFRYYASNVVMSARLRNPMGFTVTQYYVARQKQ